MKIYTVTSDFYPYIKGLFAGDSVEVLPKDYKELEPDLLVFTGGEDINPSTYGGRPRGNFYHDARDEHELSVMREIQRGRFKPSKVLGICRGLQLMNVAFGGTLVYDIRAHYGKSHAPSHPLLWKTETVFNELLSEVNSLHHQGIDNVGESMRFYRLAVEPNTGLIEAIMWGNAFFAVQFHPEFFGDKKIKDRFAEEIRKWIRGESKILLRDNSREDSRWKFATDSFISYQGAEPNILATAPEVQDAWDSLEIDLEGESDEEEDDE